MKHISLLLIFLMSSTALAFNCEGNIKNIAVSHGGKVRIHTDFTRTYSTVCNTKGTWNSVDTVTCMAWFSQLQAAYSNNKKILIMYPDLADNDGNTYTCESMPYYGHALKPSFIINTQAENN